ncbi:isoprenyl transferase [Hyphomonas sp.]|uniref:isoprenyl transferase n=1 Tax=Hyphomonas sp. TaxID=87 RepID=UPI00391C512B
MARAGISPDPSHSGGEPPAPRHIAIIMDGNGRWASAKGLPRTAGHERGVEALRRTVEAARDLGISYLTVFSFSTENWRRPAAEVNTLFALLKAYVQRDLQRLKQDGVRIRVIGQRDGLPADIAALVGRAETETVQNTRFHLTIAFNYGARNEILRAATAYAKAIADGTSKGEPSEAGFAAFLDTKDLPDPDLVIRTSGEYRISNFLLWQAAYAELLFVDVLWPDFGREDLESAILRYHERERRFGSVTPGAT